MQKLRSAGVWDQVEAFREEVRKRLRSEGKIRSDATNQAWGRCCDDGLAGPGTGPFGESETMVRGTGADGL